MKNKKLLYITEGAVIAALYAVLTIGQSTLLPGTVSGDIQFRASEVLCVLAFFTPAAIPGLTIGCLLANILAGLGAVDLIFGTLASLLAALTMWLLRNVRIAKLPVAGLLMPAVWNGLLVGLEIAIFFIDGGFTFPVFLTSAGFVALGELLVLAILGIPLYLLIEHTEGLKKLITLQ
ncbi:MAG: QueT transporter family protein [Ruminococcus sp.]|nr:QueT transporter family protein [Ruminococcus sp.]